MHAQDVVWYGRAGVWMGTALLILMAVTGRQVAVISVLAVLLVLGGLILLLYSIPFRSRDEHATAESSEPASSSASPTAGPAAAETSEG